MNKTEIKKLLYKQKPKANLIAIREGVASYSTFVEGEEREVRVLFEVPISDMGTASFFSEMESHLLNRWIVDLVH
jgi:hypothetical protein